MSTYTTNTKPDSKFEDVPEEVLTDPTMRTALGMDPIPGMNTPVDDNKQISMFDYMQNKNNSSTSFSTTTTAAPEMTVFKNLVHPEFGELRTVEISGEPWFVGKDVAEALGYSNARKAVLVHVDAEDKGGNEMGHPWRNTADDYHQRIRPLLSYPQQQASVSKRVQALGYFRSAPLYPQEWCLHP